MELLQNEFGNNGVTPEWVWKQWSYPRMGLKTMQLLQNGFENNGVTPNGFKNNGVTPEWV